MIDFDKLLEEAAPSETTVPVCLDGPLVHRYEEIKARIDARATKRQQEPDDARLGSRTAPDPEQADLDVVAAQIQERTTMFLLKAMTRARFVEFVAAPEFTARKDRQTGEVVPLDRAMGLNTSAFVPALIRASVATPDLSDDTRWEKLLAVLSHAQMDKLFGAAWDLNREDREVPFSPNGSPSPPS